MFVSVNEFDGTRKKENLLSIRALFLDFDAAPLPEHHRHASGVWPVMPDLILNTSPGQASVFMATQSGNRSPALALSATKPARTVWRGQHCRGNTCQVMRVAGFVHGKDRAKPHTVKMVHAAKHPALNDVKLLAAMFGVDLKPEKAERPKMDVSQRADKFWDSPADIATVTRILSNPDNWHLTSNGGGIYKIACLCRDFGLSPETATDTMEQLCPIAFADMSHIADKVRHAYEYATGEAGSRSFAAALAKLEDDYAK